MIPRTKPCPYQVPNPTVQALIDKAWLAYIDAFNNPDTTETEIQMAYSRLEQACFTVPTPYIKKVHLCDFFC